MDGEFIEEDELKDKISEAVNEVKSALNQPIKKLYVGVPSEFSYVENETISKNFGRQVRLTGKVIDGIFLNADKNVIEK